MSIFRWSRMEQETRYGERFERNSHEMPKNDSSFTRSRVRLGMELPNDCFHSKMLEKIQSKEYDAMCGILSAANVCFKRFLRVYLTNLFIEDSSFLNTGKQQKYRVLETVWKSKHANGDANCLRQHSEQTPFSGTTEQLLLIAQQIECNPERFRSQLRSWQKNIHELLNLFILSVRLDIFIPLIEQNQTYVNSFSPIFRSRQQISFGCDRIQLAVRLVAPPTVRSRQQPESNTLHSIAIQASLKRISRAFESW